MLHARASVRLEEARAQDFNCYVGPTQKLETSESDLRASSFLIRRKHFLLNTDTEKMNPTAVKDHLKSESRLSKRESTADILQRQLGELERRINKYFDDLNNVEKLCKKAQANVEKFRRRAEDEREIIRKDEEIQAKLFSLMEEMQEKSEKSEKPKRMDVKDDHEIPLEEKMPDASTRNALRYTKSARVCRFIKIGCALVLDVVGAYAFFKITQPYLF